MKHRSAADAELLSALELLRLRRAPYSDLFAEIVADALARSPPAPDGPIVEIGAGAGQLRDWLPPPVRARTVHTDPSEPALVALRQRTPDADTRVAPAQKLPFDDGECGAVLGLCVFDAVHASQAETAVVAEIARVLHPGGRFAHFLDMATLLEAPFEKLAAAGLIPIPNVFGDPSDHEWPLDILLIQRDWLAGLLELATRIAHPLAATFGHYFGAFLAERFNVKEATDLFKALGSNGETRHALATSLRSASALAARQGHPPFQPLPFHSGRYLRSVLETSFTQNGAFQIELAEIVTRSAWRPRSTDGARPYQSLALGHQRLSDELPERLLTDSARRDAPPDQALIEAGMFVFVARLL